MEVMGNKDANYFQSTRELIEFGATIQALLKLVTRLLERNLGNFIGNSITRIVIRL
jgi:hypothetical protein